MRRKTVKALVRLEYPFEVTLGFGVTAACVSQQRTLGERESAGLRCTQQLRHAHRAVEGSVRRLAVSDERLRHALEQEAVRPPGICGLQALESRLHSCGRLT